MNETQKEIITSAMAKALAIVYIVIFIIGLTQLITYRSVTGCLFELLFIIAVPLLVFLFARSRDKISFPAAIAGLAVRPDNTRKALTGRLRAYIFDSVSFAAVIALFIGISDIWQAYRGGSLTRLGNWLDSIGSVLVQFLIYFAAFFIFDYFLYECKAKKNREQK